MPLFFLSMFGFVKSAFTAVLEWLSRRSLAEIGCIALGLVTLLAVLDVKIEKRHSAKIEAHDKAVSLQLGLCEKGRQTDRDSYAKAQVDAKAKNLAQVKTVEQQYQRNSDDERQAYLSDLARLRGMRGQASPAPSGSADRPGSPQAPTAAAGVDANGLPLSAGDHVQAEEIELRLMHLQNWLEKQLSVDPNK